MWRLWWVMLIPMALGHPGGAPSSVCKSMKPGHHGSPQQTPSPYSISVSPATISPGAAVTVTLKSNSPGVPFKGYLVKAVSVATDQVIGRFTASPGSQTVDCEGVSGSALTHTDSGDKTSVSLTWTAPSIASGQVIFQATFVQNYPIFWVAIKADQAITISGPPLSSRSSIPVTTPPRIPPRKASRSLSPAVSALYENCGVTVGCFGNEDGCIPSKSCNMLAAFSRGNDKEVTFQLVGNSGGNNYIALGFSTDDKMGGELFACCHNTGPGSAGVFLGGTQDDWADKVSNQDSLSFQNGSYVDGVLHCTFILPNSVEANGYSANFLTSKYYALLAHGSMSGSDHLAKHDDKTVSTSKVNFTEIAIFGANNDKLFILLHGTFMIAAWVGSVSVAIFLARYYKQMWPETKHCGQKVWFSWHRGLNVLTVLLTIAAFILIFIDVGEFARSWPDNPHALIGCITTGLAVLQPIGAFFRPHPGTKRRPVFNWLHYLVGMSTHILALVTIFFAVTLDRAELPTFFWWVLIAYIAFDVIMFLVMECLTCVGRAPAQNQIAMKEYGNGSAGYTINDVYDDQATRYKEVMLVLYLVGVTGFAAALIVIVIMSPF